MLKTKRIIKVRLVSFLTLIFLLSASGILSAADKKKDDNKPKLIEVPYTFQETVYALNLLNGVQLSGEEVIPFLQIYNPLKESAEKARKNNKKETDIISVKMSIPAISNLITFTRRVTLTGAEAVRFDSIIKKAAESAQKEE